jgi:hypothetical protein
MLYFTTSLPMYVEVLVCVVEVVEVVEVVVEVKDPLGASFSASLAQAQKSEQAWRKPKSWSEPGASRLVYHSTNCSQLEPTAHNSNHQPYHIAIPDLYLIDIYTIHTYHTYIPYIHTIHTYHTHPSPSTTSCSYKVTVWGYIVALVVFALKNHHAMPLPSCGPCLENPSCTHHHCANVARRYLVRHPYGINLMWLRVAWGTVAGTLHHVLLHSIIPSQCVILHCSWRWTTL